MSFINIDVHSDFFTPQEYPVEILEVAKNNDVVTCCLTPPAKQFVAFMLIKEFYYRNEGLSIFIQTPTTSEEKDQDQEDEEPLPEELDSNSSNKKQKRSGSEKESKKSACIEIESNNTQPSGNTNPIPVCHLPLESLTNIPTTRFSSREDEIGDEDKFNCTNSSCDSSVLVCSGSRFLELCRTASKNEFLSRVNLIVIDDVHDALRDTTIRKELLEILTIIRNCNKERSSLLNSERSNIRTVFLTVSLLHFYGNESDGFWRMEETFKRLEALCCAKVDTTSDVVALLRYSTSPKERVVEFSPSFLEDIAAKLSVRAKEILEPVKSFLESHTFDALSSYVFDNGVSTTSLEDNEESDSMIEELRKIPHPKTEPLQVLEQFLLILETFGPWCAYRSLILLIHLVEKLKVRTPYERHYLLLGALHTRFTLVQKTFLTEFNKLKPIEVLEQFSTPKLRSVLDILRRFDLTHPVEPIRQRCQEKFDDEDEDGDDDSFNQENGQVGNKNEGKQRSKMSRKGVTFEHRSKRGGGRGGRRKQHQIKKPNETETSQQETAVENEVEKVPAADMDHILENSKVIENGLQENDLKEDDDFKSQENHISEVQAEVIVVEESKDADLANGPVPTNVNHQKRSPNKRRPAGGHHKSRFSRRSKNFQRADEASLCGIIFVENRLDARILYHFLKEAAFADPKLVGLNPTIAIDPNAEYAKDSREAEMEHKRREECLKKFRYREANLLIGTSLLEEGIELPKANLTIRFDPAKSFRSYLFSKGRAQGFDAEYYVFSTKDTLGHSLRQLSTYKVVQECLLSRSIIQKPHITSESLPTSEQEWDIIFPRFKAAKLSNAIAIVNRYCARLPSDTFTRLVPLWNMDHIKSQDGSSEKYACSLRLPINSPVKWVIRGVPMPSISLAKQAVALQTVVILHSNGELDDTLVPIGKESVKQEPDLYEGDDTVDEDCGEFRPGSTKRRQYYNKQLAPELTQCLPKAQTPAYLYWIRMVLTCPLPEEQNTRGRKLHPPECAPQCFGIIVSNPIPPFPPFPIYTRCGEVQVQLIHVIIGEEPNLKLSEENIERISAFHHYTFTSVLRLDKYLTLFDPNLSENSFYVVPLKKVSYSEGEGDVNPTLDMDKDETVTIDWEFVDAIWKEKDVVRPRQKPDNERKDYEFKPEDYLNAVVMPWYRNHDVPQYFYVAEICENLTPRSQFPGCEFKTFEEYYNKKYTIAIQNTEQPLLDVDHTSARLNFLTPRYVNRKGMALPTSSESTKKAKRENLEQKQILVPELCAIHPFSASLWRQAVCLPCILYRMNCILLANSIRIMVASEIHGLGSSSLPKEYLWDPLSFGWTLSDVIAASNPLPALENTDKSDCKKEDGNTCSDGSTDSKNSEKGCDEDGTPQESGESKENEEEEELTGFAKAAKEGVSANVSLAESLLMDKLFGKSANEILSEEMKKCRQPTLEIGTWSNEMASETLANEPDYDEDEDELMDPTVALPSNLMMLDKNWTWGGRSRLFNHRVHRALYGSPTHWGEVWDQDAFVPIEDLDDASGADGDNLSVTSDMSGSDESFLDEENNFKIQFHNGNTAEALDKRKLGTAFDRRVRDEWFASEDLWWQMDDLEDVPKNLEQTQSNDPTNASLSEDLLRKDFEERIEENITTVADVIKWNDLKSLGPRRKKQSDDDDNKNMKPKDEYEMLFKELTTVVAPPCVPESAEFKEESVEATTDADKGFSFDYQPTLGDHVGPSPCQILQALTMSNANDGLNLERLETIGDSFLKYAITSYLFCTFENIHEGKLSHLRSKQVSNVHLYRLGRRRGLGGVMVATKFEPHDNWLPPGYHIPKELNKAFLSKNSQRVPVIDPSKYWKPPDEVNDVEPPSGSKNGNSEVVPYNLVTQQSIPDKSIADCVEALIGAYLTSMGPLGALLFMSWLGIRVLPSQQMHQEEMDRIKGTPEKPLFYMRIPKTDKFIYFETLRPPKSPLLRFSQNCESHLRTLLKGYNQFETAIGYNFRDKSYLLQAFTHASYTPNNLTDCYQRLEFLGDAILDYLITRYLYEDPLQHSPGSLTDLRSALVNNTIFASLAVKNGFHKYFRHCSPGLAVVLQKFVTFQEQHGHTLTQDYYLMDEEECEEAEDIEVPKALGDVFESVAGAIFLDSGMSLDAVWNVYYRIMKQEIEEFSKNVPKSPIRELLELEPETAKFGKPEKLWDGRRVRVSVDIFGVGTFRGIGRNYRIAKCTAAKCALRHVRKMKNSTVTGS